MQQNLKTRPVEVVSELLKEEAGNTDAEWLLWMSVRGMIANPAFAFPLIKVPVRRMPACADIGSYCVML